MRNANRGMSLVELLASLAIAVVICMALIQISRGYFKSIEKIRLQADAIDLKLMAMEQIDCKQTALALPLVGGVRTCNPNDVDINAKYVVGATVKTLFASNGTTKVGKYFVKAQCRNVSGASAANGFRIDVLYSPSSAGPWKSVFTNNQLANKIYCMP